MTDSELALLSIADASSRIASREISPVELTESYLRRIDAFNPGLNAYITITADLALQGAKRAEADIAAGNYLGAMHGIPIGLKDIIDTEGVLTTCGSKILADNVPTEDSAVAAKLKAAGAVLLGKLNTHEFALGGTNINPHVGDAHNPWDLARITGGSSGGSGTATTAALAAGTIGTDTGGSIRIPAALCGCVGMKPTHGRVSKRGIHPDSQIFDHAGPMTRTVEDNAIMLAAVAGYDPADPYSTRIPVDDYLTDLEAGIAGLRIGVPGGIFADYPEPEVKAAFDAALELLTSLGAVVVPSELTVTREQVTDVMYGSLEAEVPFIHRKHLGEGRLKDYGPDLQEAFFSSPPASAQAYLTAVAKAEAMRVRFRTALESVDVLATPAVAVTAPTIEEEKVPGQTRERMNVVALLNAPMNHAQVPTLTLPCGFDRKGLPIGLSLTGRPFDEALLYRAGYAYEQAAGWFTTRPDDSLYA